MLHILLLILKIIGILLLVLLALLLLLLLTISFSPLGYRGEVSCRGNPETLFARVRFHWLFHLISGEVAYQNGGVNWRLRAAWKRMGDAEAESMEKNAGSDDETEEEQSADEAPDLRECRSREEAQEPQEELSAEDAREIRGIREAEETCENPVVQNLDTEAKIPVEEHRSGTTPDMDEKYRKVSRKGHRLRENKTQKKKAKKQSFSERFEKYAKRIKYTFRSFCDKIKALEKKKDRLKAFVESETHRKAFFRVLRELKRFFRFLRPKKLNMNIEFGCKNPEYTGYILAGISMIYPLIGEYTELQPDFERRILKGNACIEGRFRVIYVLIVAWNLIWDKNVRTTYRHIRKFKL